MPGYQDENFAKFTWRACCIPGDWLSGVARRAQKTTNRLILLTCICERE
jgi:hypothetical protein